MEKEINKGWFHGISDEHKTSGRLTVRRMFEKAAVLSDKYGSKETVLVDIDTGECITGKSFVDILTDDRRTWNIFWEVEIKSIRNDLGHLSIIYDSGIEQENGDPDE